MMKNTKQSKQVPQSSIVAGTKHALESSGSHVDYYGLLTRNGNNFYPIMNTKLNTNDHEIVSISTNQPSFKTNNMTEKTTQETQKSVSDFTLKEVKELPSERRQRLNPFAQYLAELEKLSPAELVKTNGLSKNQQKKMRNFAINKSKNFKGLIVEPKERNSRKDEISIPCVEVVVEELPTTNTGYIAIGLDGITESERPTIICERNGKEVTQIKKKTLAQQRKNLKRAEKHKRQQELTKELMTTIFKSEDVRFSAEENTTEIEEIPPPTNDQINLVNIYTVLAEMQEKCKNSRQRLACLLASPILKMKRQQNIKRQPKSVSDFTGPTQADENETKILESVAYERFARLELARKDLEAARVATMTLQEPISEVKRCNIDKEVEHDDDFMDLFEKDSSNYTVDSEGGYFWEQNPSCDHEYPHLAKKHTVFTIVDMMRGRFNVCYAHLKPVIAADDVLHCSDCKMTFLNARRPDCLRKTKIRVTRHVKLCRHFNVGCRKCSQASSISGFIYHHPERTKYEIRNGKTYLRNEQTSPVYEKMLEKLVKSNTQFLDFNVDMFKDLFANMDMHSFSIEHIHNFVLPPSLEKMLTSLNKEINWLSVGRDLLFAVFNMYLADFSYTSVVTNVLHFALTHNLLKLISPLVTRIKQTLNPNTQGPSNPPIIFMTAIAAVLVVTLACKTLPPSKDIDTFIGRFSKIGACCGSVEKMFSVGSGLGQTISDFFYYQVHGTWPQRDDMMEPFDSFCDRVQRMYTVDFEAKVIGNVAMCTEIERLLLDCDKLLKTRDTLKIPQSQLTRFHNAIVVLHKMRTAAAIGGSADEPRVGAMIVQAYGATGVGKSALLHYMNTDLLIANGCRDPKDLTDRVHYRTSGSDYFDGCNNHIIGFVIDDYGMVRDSLGKPNTDATNVVRASNSAPWRLEMSDVVYKGKVAFKAKYVILTSNVKEFNFSQSLSNAEAVQRRIDFRFEVLVKDEFALNEEICGKKIRRLDEAKVEEVVKINPEAMRDVWEFKTDTEEIIDYDEMMKRCIKIMESKIIRGNRMLDQVKNYFRQKVIDKNEAELNNSIDNNLWDMRRDDAREYYERYPYSNTQGLIYVEPNAAFSPSWNPFKCYVHLDKIREYVYSGAHNECFGSEHHKLDEDYMDFPMLRPSPLRSACTALVPTRLVKDFVSAYITTVRTHCKGIIDFEKTFRKYYLGSYELGTVYEPDEERKSLIGRMMNTVNFSMTKKWSTIGFIAVGLAMAYVFAKIAMKVGSALVEVGKKLTAKLIRTEYAKKERFYLPQWAFMLHPDWSVMDLWRKYRQPERMEENGLPKNLLQNEIERLKQNQQLETAKELEDYLKRGTQSHQEVTRGPRKMNVQSERTLVKIDDINFTQLSDKENSVLISKYGTVQLCSVHSEKIGASHLYCDACVVLTDFDSGETQADRDQNAEELKIILAKNCFRMFAETNREHDYWISPGTMTVLQGRVAMCNIHTLRACKDKKMLIVNSAYPQGFEFEYKDLNIAEQPEEHRDLALIELPPHFPTMRSIMNSIVTREDISRMREVSGISLVGYSKENYFKVTETDKAAHGVDFLANDGLNGSFLIRKCYKYAIPTVVGDCGSVVLINNKSMARKICGIHVAGCNGQFSGVGIAFTKEYIMENLPKMRRKESWLDATVSLPTGAVQAEMSDIELVKEGEMIAKMPPQFNPTKTNIRKSPLHGIFPVVTKPAHLKPVLVDGKWIDPMALGREKVFTPNYYFDETVLDRCVENYKQLLFKTVEPSDRIVLTKEESIQGIPSVEFYEPIKRSTSPGFGWKSDKPGKTQWLGADDYILDDPELERVWSQMLRNVKEGKRTGTIWTDTLKDERRPIEKVNQGKTRLFAASEMAYVVLFRQYFMGFAAHMARNRIDVESCVGVNPYSYDWTKLARRLAAVGNNIVAGDFSNYDGTLSGQVLWRCLDTINDFYGDSEENQSIRRALWMDIVHSVHIGRFGNKSYLYVWSHSQPSGCPITAILNSLYHSIVARYVYVMAAHKYAPDFIPLENFNRYVAHNNFGDDDLYSISDEIVDWYNQETMTELFPLVGMTYTDEAKSGKCVKSRKLEEVAFLKRGFRYVKEEGRYQCPLSLDTIREMAMWCKGGVDQQLVTAETLVEAIEELARHPREVFEELIPTFRLGTTKLERPPILMSYDEYCEKDLLRNFIQEKSIPLNQIRTIPMNPRSTKQDKKTVSVFNCGLIQSDTTPATIPKPEESLQEERYGPVIFAEDGDVAETQDVEVLAQNITNTNLVDEYTLKSFLERPYRISSFVIDKQTAGTKISSINIPNDFLSIRSISKKLEGFRFLKCNFKIRVQVNAQPFQAGRLLLFFDPNWQDTVHALSNMDSLSGMTGYPHVELDFSENTSAELTVPFIPAIAGYDLVSKTGGGGAVHIVIYGACANGPVSATVFIRATEVEISVPTSGSVQADKEERKRPGNIETISKSVGSVAKMASMIPGAGAIAAPVSAVADAVGGLASIFGFSKPVDPEFPTEVAPCLGRYMTNFNGDSKSKMLALDARNTVTPPTGCTWSDQDELSVAYVMQRPCFYNTFTLDTNQKEGHFVYETEVAPSVFQTVLSDKILYVQNNTFLSYFGNIFEYWRGGIKFTLKFVKTNYHSGRVRVSFSPGASNNASATTEVSFDYSKIIDLREGTTFEFVCPYSATSPWLGTGQDIGRFRVEVINSLVASSVAASSITCLVEVSGAEDFQWAVPMRTDHYIPRIGKELPMPKPSDDEGDVQMDIAPVQKLDYAANEVTTGEVVASFRQLLKRYELTTALTAEVPLYTGSAQTYKGRTPDIVDAQIKSDNTDHGYATAPVSYYSWIRNCYRFWNGSHRLGIPLNSKIGHRIVGLYENGMNLDNMVNAFAVPSLEGLTEIAIPFYSQFALSRVFVTGCTEGLKEGGYSHLPVVIKKVWVEGDTTDEDEHFFRAVGEDFNFFYLVGPPQTMVRKLT